MNVTSPTLKGVKSRAPNGVFEFFTLSRDRLQIWGIKSALSLVDQALTSAASFGSNILLARWITSNSYGAFAVAFSGYLFVSGFHNVLLLEPLSVIGPARYKSGISEYFRAQLVVHAVLVFPLAIATILGSLVVWRVVPGSPLVGALLGAGIALPGLLLLWLVRRMCYVMQQPMTAVVGSGFYVLFVLAGLSILRHFGQVTPFVAFVLMGGGSFLASCILLRRLAPKHRGSTSIAWRGQLRENWNYGRWLLGSALLYAASSQTQTFFVAAFLGLGAAGILRAMQIPSLVMLQLITAAGLLVLPSLSYDYGEGEFDRLRRKAMFVSVALTIMTVCFVCLLTVFARGTEHMLFAGKYVAHAWLIPVLALIPVANAISIGSSMYLRASQQPHFDLISNAVAAPIAVISALLLIRWWGLAGAAASMVVSFVTLSVMTFVCFGRYLNSRTVVAVATRE
jgi:O-antigen/teichoic acid export membrane protein